MATEIKVPVLPESVSDAVIATWHKKVGDAVKRDENIVDLETDKVVLEVPSTVDGVIKELKFAEGATVLSQQVIAIIEEGYADKSLRNVGAPRVVAYGILGIIGWTHRWFRPERSEVSAEEIGKIYAEMILSGLESHY